MDNRIKDFSACMAAGGESLRPRIEEARQNYSPLCGEYLDGILSKGGRKLSESLCGFLLLDNLLVKNKIDRSGLIISRNGDGRPAVINRQDIDFSISHSEGAACCALLIGGGSIGCDIQRVREYSERKMSRLAEIFMNSADYMEFLRTENEALFYTVWTRREAYIKANGGDVFQDLRELNLKTDSFKTEKITAMGNRYYYSICVN